MALEQDSKFELNLELGESYIFGTAFTSDNSYSINIQQTSNNLIVLPSDFINITELREAVVSFTLPVHSGTNEIFVRFEVKIGRGDLIEVYLSQDDVLLSLSNHLPVEMTLHTAQSTLSNNVVQTQQYQIGLI